MQWRLVTDVKVQALQHAVSRQQVLQAPETSCGCLWLVLCFPVLELYFPQASNRSTACACNPPMQAWTCHGACLPLAHWSACGNSPPLIQAKPWPGRAKQAQQCIWQGNERVLSMYFAATITPTYACITVVVYLSELSCLMSHLLHIPPHTTIKWCMGDCLQSNHHDGRCQVPT